MQTNIFFYVYLIQYIDKARDLLDTELTALAGESYSRAYGVSNHLNYANCFKSKKIVLKKL